MKIENTTEILLWKRTRKFIFVIFDTFRHVLFNGGYQSLIIRMALLTLICDAYISWAQSAEAGEFFEKEYEFYVMCLKLFIGKRLG